MGRREEDWAEENSKEQKVEREEHSSDSEGKIKDLVTTVGAMAVTVQAKALPGARMLTGPQERGCEQSSSKFRAQDLALPPETFTRKHSNMWQMPAALKDGHTGTRFVSGRVLQDPGSQLSISLHLWGPDAVTSGVSPTANTPGGGFPVAQSPVLDAIPCLESRAPPAIQCRGALSQVPDSAQCPENSSASRAARKSPKETRAGLTVLHSGNGQAHGQGGGCPTPSLHCQRRLELWGMRTPLQDQSPTAQSAGYKTTFSVTTKHG
ncbi:hypothetical protein P7K49_009076 [Saguinus oedipus]|uniref:Uncharacterized protein n=1 Tax=Saguinus oedipus TaxID=9490 RepID=A0ABQ9W0B6_SAGOE|nr:hypothetical protein P7K49_009076 [Saguinus oedipus]